MNHYDPKAVEEKWKKEWFSKNIYFASEKTTEHALCMRAKTLAKRAKEETAQLASRRLHKTENNSKNPKKYVLVEFPYPSGEGLHVGHAFTMTGADVFARKKRMEGNNVLFPMGWDAFGLPTENYAIKTGIKPQVATAKNTKMFKEQMERLGFSFDWSREVNTSDPNYYKWTQWIFTELFKHGLAYKKKMAINWCPKCRIGLANEEVVKEKLKDQAPVAETFRSPSSKTNAGSLPVSPSACRGGKASSTEISVCERCGTQVEKKELDQWLLRITAYADRLADDLDLVDFPESVKASQRNWIGRSTGAKIRFKIKDLRFKNKEVVVFTTRPDTIFGATFLVISPEHPLVAELLNDQFDEEYFYQFLARSKLSSTNLTKSTSTNFSHARNCQTNSNDLIYKQKKGGVPVENCDIENSLKIRKLKIENYVAQARAKSELERTDQARDKTGVFTGLYAINPATGKEIPVWISDFVLSTYGTGAIMSVPAHDSRDWEFAKKYKLPITSVILATETADVKSAATTDTVTVAFTATAELPFTGYGVLTNSGQFTGMESEKAIPAICSWLKEQGIGESATTYHLRDWIFSRQHYWGEPIPMIYCEECSKKGITWWEAQNSKRKTQNLNSKLKSECLNTKYSLPNTSLAGWFPVPLGELPVELPDIEKYQPTGTGESPLASVKAFVETKCPNCGGPARRETDTMPNWAGSSWYYLAYCFANELNDQLSSTNLQTNSNDLIYKRKKKEISSIENCDIKNSLKIENCKIENSKKSPSKRDNIFETSRNILDHWLPVDTYFGGSEHTTLHLLYSRFWHKFLFDLGLVSTSEPYQKRIVHGVILGPDGSRMSKSKGNVINPDEVIKAYSADIIRLYFMFMGPFDGTMAWDNKGVEGVARFLNRVWNLSCRGDILCRPQARQPASLDASLGGGLAPTNNISLRRKLHQTIKKVGNDIDTFHYNTAIAAMMEFVNAWSTSEEPLSKEDLVSFIKIMAPFAPFMAEELFCNFVEEGFPPRLAEGETGSSPSSNANAGGLKSAATESALLAMPTRSVHISSWPKFDPELVKEEEVPIAVQINGKLRATFKISADKATDEQLVVITAKELPEIVSRLVESKVVKVIFVAGKLINFVVISR